MRLCAYLADRVEINTGERPEIGKKWLDSARLMLDTDHRTEDQIRKAIDWCQSDEFWRDNILSMPTLRKQYIQLRMKAQAQARRANGQHPPGGSTADRKLAETQALKEEIRRDGLALTAGNPPNTIPGRAEH